MVLSTILNVLVLEEEIIPETVPADRIIPSPSSVGVPTSDKLEPDWPARGGVKIANEQRSAPTPLLIGRWDPIDLGRIGTARYGVKRSGRYGVRADGSAARSSGNLRRPLAPVAPRRAPLPFAAFGGTDRITLSIFLTPPPPGGQLPPPPPGGGESWLIKCQQGQYNMVRSVAVPYDS